MSRNSPEKGIGQIRPGVARLVEPVDDGGNPGGLGNGLDVSRNAVPLPLPCEPLRRHVQPADGPNRLDLPHDAQRGHVVAERKDLFRGEARLLIVVHASEAEGEEAVREDLSNLGVELDNVFPYCSELALPRHHIALQRVYQVRPSLPRSCLPVARLEQLARRLF